MELPDDYLRGFCGFVFRQGRRGSRREEDQRSRIDPASRRRYRAALDLHYFCGLETFGASGNREFNLVAFCERFEAAALNGRMMHKYILTRFAADETVAFFVIKPLHCTLFFHCSSFIAGPATAGNFFGSPANKYWRCSGDPGWKRQTHSRVCSRCWFKAGANA
jgi:hypothetical protein